MGSLRIDFFVAGGQVSRRRGAGRFPTVGGDCGSGDSVDSVLGLSGLCARMTGH
jgi:hypothetical protein